MSEPTVININAVLEELDRQLQSGGLGLSPVTIEEALAELAGIIRKVHPNQPQPPTPVLLHIYRMLAQAVLGGDLKTGFTLVKGSGEVLGEVSRPEGVTLQ